MARASCGQAGVALPPHSWRAAGQGGEGEEGEEGEVGQDCGQGGLASVAVALQVSRQQGRVGNLSGGNSLESG